MAASMRIRDADLSKAASVANLAPSSNVLRIFAKSPCIKRAFAIRKMTLFSKTESLERSESYAA